MRIVFLELSPSGGLFQFTYQLAAGLARQGHDVEIVTGPQPELTSSDPRLVVRSVLPTWHTGSAGEDHPLFRRVRRVGRAVRHVWSLVRALSTILRTRPDVFFWHVLRFSVDNWAVVASSYLPHTRICLVMHETQPLVEQAGSKALYRSDPVLHWSIAAATRRLDAIFTLSEDARDYVQAKWSPRGTVTVIPHGDEGVFLSGAEPTPAGQTPPNVLFFGTWTTYKGIDVLLDAFEQVRTRVPEASLTLAGPVGNVDVEHVRRRARMIGQVDVRPGYVPMSGVAELMNTHRVVALPYLRARQSGVAHLAQTFARPVVATRVGDIPDVIDHGRTGLLVEPEDARGLADALVNLLDNPAEAERIGTEGARSLRRSGSWDGVASKVSSALKDPRSA